MNLMTVDGHVAKIEYDPDRDMFRGEILGLNGGADFWGRNPEELREEFRLSLSVFLDTCRRKGIEPYRKYSGRLLLRIPPELHARALATAEAAGKSLNAWLKEIMDEAIKAA